MKVKSNPRGTLKFYEGKSLRVVAQRAINHHLFKPTDEWVVKVRVLTENGVKFCQFVKTFADRNSAREFVKAEWSNILRWGAR